MVYKNFDTVEKAEKYLGAVVKDLKGKEWKIEEFYMTEGDVVAMIAVSVEDNVRREFYNHIEFTTLDEHPLGEIDIEIMKSHIEDYLAIASYSHYEATHDNELSEPLKKLLLERVNAIHNVVRNEELIIKEVEKMKK